MKGKSKFTRKEADSIIALIRRKVVANAQEQKNLRDKIRKIGFYASDFGIGGGYNEKDFLRVITIVGGDNDYKMQVKDTLSINENQDVNRSTLYSNKELSDTNVQSFGHISAPDAKILILGTMPGQESLRTNQYYANPRNQFWPIMLGCFNQHKLFDYEDKVKLLTSNKVALWDVLKICEREGSLDNAISNETPNDFRTFFHNHPHIKCILFNGADARSYYEKYVSIGKDIQFYTMPSTSPTNTRYTKEQKLKVWKDVLDSILLQKL